MTTKAFAYTDAASGLRVAHHYLKSAMDSLQQVEHYDKSYPTATIKVDGHELVYGVPNRMALSRVTTLETKEPETLAWLKSFAASDIFVDVGANVGMYSIFAAAYSGASVYAFEPEAQNYALLNRNIEINRLSDKVLAWCCALINEAIVDRLYLSTTKGAHSGHTFGEAIGPALEPRKAAFVQGCISYTLDGLVETSAIPQPNHIKVDVDGLEHLVIEGALQTIARPETKTVLVEISPHVDSHANLIKELEHLGFSYDQAQVDRARRKRGPTEGYAEYIFHR